MNKCAVCNEETKDSIVSYTFERFGQKFTYHNIKARVCKSCGEEFLDGVTVTKIEKEIKERIFEKAA